MQDSDVEIFALKEKNKLLNERLEEIYKEFYELKKEHSELLKDFDRNSYYEQDRRCEALVDKFLLSQSELVSLSSDNEKLRDTNNQLTKKIKELEQTVEDLSIKLVRNEIKDAIKKHNPVDFDDVWTIVINELKKGKNASVSFDDVVKSVKKYNPSLFYDFPSFS